MSDTHNVGLQAARKKQLSQYADFGKACTPSATSAADSGVSRLRFRAISLVPPSLATKPVAWAVCGGSIRWGAQSLRSREVRDFPLDKLLDLSGDRRLPGSLFPEFKIQKVRFLRRPSTCIFLLVNALRSHRHEQTPLRFSHPITH
ncbi:MAG: hypothetical protein ABI702_16575 [Burkholderiales bacterium]